MFQYKDYRAHLCQEIEKIFGTVENKGIIFSPPQEESFGDYTTNAAMVLAKVLRKSPQDIAQTLKKSLEEWPNVAKVEIGHPGYLNIFLCQEYWQQSLRHLLSQRSRFGTLQPDENKRINVEYVSANPTGPLHVGHGRIAVVGDVLSNLLEAAGYHVTKEYYVNDAGAQVDHLTRSIYWHYCRHWECPEPYEFPDQGYRGAYVSEIAEALAERHGQRYVNVEPAVWDPVFRADGLHLIMKLIQEDLKSLSIHQDVMTFESKIQERLDSVMEIFESKGLVYCGRPQEAPKSRKGSVDPKEQRPLTLLRSLDGDDVDRPLKKADGSWTYFASDIAYHWDKVQRGFSQLINIWGADHDQYVVRMKNALKALSPQVSLHVVLCQMVQLSHKGEELKMSKRAGTFVLLRDVVKSIGADAFRFLMITQSPHTHMDFCLEDILRQSKDNPIFYIQYAYARACSVFRAAESRFGEDSFSDDALSLADLSYLEPEDWQFMKKLWDWPRQVERAAELYEPHRLCIFLHDVAKSFHGLWTQGRHCEGLRFVYEDHWERTRAKLALIQALRWVIRSGFKVFGVMPLEEMSPKDSENA